MEKMDFENLQPRVFTQLKKSLKEQRIGHAYLFEGEQGTGKKELARWMAQAIFCLSSSPDKQPCMKCTNCTRIESGNHPDVLMVAPDGQTIKVDQIRDMKTAFNKSGVETSKKVMIVEDSDKMTTNAANSLLKFLEEPEGQMHVFLLTKNKARILPTIQSRCQILSFQPLSKQYLQETLIAEQVSKGGAVLLSKLTNSLEEARSYAKDAWFEEARNVSKQWFDYLIERDNLAFIYVQKQLIKTFKEKQQQQLLFELLLIRYRDMLFEEATSEEIALLQPKKQNKLTQIQLLTSVEELLSSQKKLDRNVGFQNVCEQLAWRLIKNN